MYRIKDVFFMSDRITVIVCSRLDMINKIYNTKFKPLVFDIIGFKLVSIIQILLSYLIGPNLKVTIVTIVNRTDCTCESFPEKSKILV